MVSSAAFLFLYFLSRYCKTVYIKMLSAPFLLVLSQLFPLYSRKVDNVPVSALHDSIAKQEADTLAVVCSSTSLCQDGTDLDCFDAAPFFTL